MAQNLLAACLLVVLVISVGVSAKRGCSAFGHSCFGGHGKRSDNAILNPSSIELGRRQLGQEETPPHPVYPHAGFGILPSGDDIIPVRDGGIYENYGSNERSFMKMKLRNIVKHWMDNLRRSQTNDGYYIESL
ncbi:neuropeptide CCHamide-2 [Leptidea sinapis]|uniref:neuropeptide CCHamide-2 n=1 Tax=Leptidea sinapis TaxID=189913 RepID=UPI0021C41544|nr:neuropeptide CCHamide-2 [Leptidea sinapis]